MSQAHHVDTHVGERVRQRRALIGQTQQALAAELGISFQQVQKYERGANRVSCSMLWEIARAQGTTPAHYFEGLQADPPIELGEAEAKAERWLLSPDAVPFARAMVEVPVSRREAVLRSAHAMAGV